MSYLQFDLDALKHVPDAARAARCSEESLGYGLVRLWQYCWTAKVDVVTSTHIAGFFCGNNEADETRVSSALVAFGFLEQTGKSLRVKGADKYLRITKAQSKAGKTNAKNLRQGAGPKPGGSRGRPGGGAGEDPEGVSESAPALTASSEQRAAILKSTAGELALAVDSVVARAKDVAAKKPRESDLLESDFLAATGQLYLWSGAKDGVALAELKKVATIEEIRARWRVGLGAPAEAWASCRTVAELRTKWNHLAPHAAKPKQIDPLDQRVM